MDRSMDRFVSLVSSSESLPPSSSTLSNPLKMIINFSHLFSEFLAFFLVAEGRPGAWIESLFNEMSILVTGHYSVWKSEDDTVANRRGGEMLFYRPSSASGPSPGWVLRLKSVAMRLFESHRAWGILMMLMIIIISIGTCPIYSRHIRSSSCHFQCSSCE